MDQDTAGIVPILLKNMNLSNFGKIDRLCKMYMHSHKFSIDYFHLKNNYLHMWDKLMD